MTAESVVTEPVVAGPATRRRGPGRHAVGLRRGLGLALAGVLLTAGCAAGRDAQTANQVPTQDGTNANVGDIALRGLSLAAPAGRDYYAPGSDIPINLVLVNNGRRTDTMTNIVSADARGWASYQTEAQAEQVLAQGLSRRQPSSSGPSTSSSSTPRTGGRSSTPTGPSSTAASPSQSPTSQTPTGSTAVPIATGRRVSWGVPDATGGLLLLTATRRIYPGTSVKLTFTFERAGEVTVTVPVQLSDNPGDATIAPQSGATDGG